MGKNKNLEDELHGDVSLLQWEPRFKFLFLIFSDLRRTRELIFIHSHWSTSPHLKRTKRLACLYIYSCQAAESSNRRDVTEIIPNNSLPLVAMNNSRPLSRTKDGTESRSNVAAIFRMSWSSMCQWQLCFDDTWCNLNNIRVPIFCYATQNKLSEQVMV